MGGGNWSHSSHTANETAKRAMGYRSGMKFTEDVAAGRAKAGAHELVDPGKVAGPTSPNAGKIIREAFDNKDHPLSRPIVIGFDQTGSMRGTPPILQQKLGVLHGLVERKGYVDDPQFCFCAIGDARNRERAPVQVGQFEADNRGDEALENLYLEGNGGGGNHESYDLLAYYMAYHTDLDSVKKRNTKGLMFFLGDERLYATVNVDDVRRYIGEEAAKDFKARFEGDTVPTEQVFRDLQEKFDVWFLYVRQGGYSFETVAGENAGTTGGTGFGDPAIGWKKVLSDDKCLILEEVNAVSETIGLIIGIHEGTVDLDEGLDDLKDLGSDATSIAATGKSLAAVGAGSGGGAVAKTEGGPSLDDKDAERN